MTDTLRERVAEAMWMADPDPYDPADRRPFAEADWEARRNYLAEADAAIALVLEEAAKVCEITFDSEMASYGDYFAAAIRGLKEKG